MKVIGLDLGTTTLSAIVLDTDSGFVLEAVNQPNRGALHTGNGWEKAQDPDQIVRDVRKMLDDLLQRHGPIASIGIDGQMHGMLYVDGDGRAVSPLYTWQDQRCEQPFAKGTYASELSRLTGYAMASGFGLATHFWFLRNGCIPLRARTLCTLFDYTAMQLTGSSAPRVHISGAASMGLLDPDTCSWDEAALRNAGIDPDFLPPVIAGCEMMGYTAQGIPVSCGIGDNQASFLGAVRNPRTSVLINMGTGGQVSILGKAAGELSQIEQRPLNGEDRILVGASLCGGRAYALLEQFFRSCVRLAGAGDEKLYEAMNRLAFEVNEETEPLTVSTLFCGTRKQPGLRGAILNIGETNFDAAHLIAGTLCGMAEELHTAYREMEEYSHMRPEMLVGSGNAMRRNPALQRAFERRFGLPVQIPAHQEEAAYGAALYGMTAAGLTKTLEEAQQLIRYEGESLAL